MMSFNTGTEIKVGIFVFAALAILGYMSVQVGSSAFFADDTYDLKVTFDNVTGLKPDAPVEIAGIEVGRVRSIDLVGQRAQLTLELSKGVKVQADVVASIKSRGVLGDKFVELNGGTKAFPRLKHGQAIAQSDRSADLEVLFEKVGQIADDIGLVAKSVANVMGGPEGERDLRLTFQSMRDLSVGLNKMVQTNMESVNLIVANLRDFSGDLKDVSSTNKQGINTIVQNFEVASKQLNNTLQTMNSVLAKIDDGQGPMAKMVNDKDMGKDLKETVASLESVARKIDEGKGTLGKLVNDDTTSKELDEALEGINRYLAKQDSFKTRIDFHGEHLAESGDTKSYLNVELHPNEDHYYLLGVVSDPKGRTKETETVTETWSGGGYSEVREVEEKTERDGIQFNAQLAKRWDDIALRGGLFESTGGAALDYYLWDDRVKLFFEAFDFDHNDPPQLKAGMNLYFLRNFYVTAGMDDFASNSGDSSFFAGAGMRFTDDDLKYLLGNVPVPGMD